MARAIADTAHTLPARGYAISAATYASVANSNLLPVTVTYGKVVDCLSFPVGSGRGRGIDHYSKVTRERASK